MDAMYGWWVFADEPGRDAPGYSLKRGPGGCGGNKNKATSFLLPLDAYHLAFRQTPSLAVRPINFDPANILLFSLNKFKRVSLGSCFSPSQPTQLQLQLQLQLLECSLETPADARSQGHKSSIPTSSMAGLAFPSPRPSLSPYTGTSSPRLITKPDPASALMLSPETLKTRLPSGRGAVMESGGFAGGRGDLHTVCLSDMFLRNDAPMRMIHWHASSCIRHRARAEEMHLCD